MEETEMLDLSDRFLRSFGGAVRAMHVMFRSDMEKYGATWQQFGLLMMVKRNSPVAITELSGRLRIAPPSASRMVDSLVEKGMLERVKDTRDHRMIRVKLTRKSRRLLKKITGQQDEMMREVFADEEPERLEEFVRLMDRLSDRWLTMAEHKTGVFKTDE